MVDLFSKVLKVVAARSGFAMVVDPSDFDFSVVSGLPWYSTGELFGSNNSSVMYLHVTYSDFVKWFCNLNSVDYVPKKSSSQDKAL